MKGILFAALILTGLDGCTPVETVPGSGGATLQITQGTVGVYQQLKIGVTNIVKAGSVTAADAKRRALVVGLALVIDGYPPQEKDVQLHAGQKTTFGKYSVYVEEIRGTTKGVVTLRVE